MVSVKHFNLEKTIVMVGLMGCGKTAIGKRLADELNEPFFDTDQVIEEREQLTIAEIFNKKGEPYFREKEQQVITEFLNSGRCILSIGGGAFLNEELRKVIKEKAISVWIKADLDTLFERVSRKLETRPLLAKGDPKKTLMELMDHRYPVYKTADVNVETTTGPHEIVVKRILQYLRRIIGEDDPEDEF